MKTNEENPKLSIEAHRSFPVYPEFKPELTIFICGLGAIPAFYMTCCFMVFAGPPEILVFYFGAILLILPGFFYLHHVFRSFLRIPPYQEALSPKSFALYYYLGVVAPVVLIFMGLLLMRSVDSHDSSFAVNLVLHIAFTVISTVGMGLFAVGFAAAWVNLFYLAFFAQLTIRGFLNVFRIRQLKELGYRNFTMRECLQFLRLVRRNRVPLVPVDELTVIPDVDNNGPSLIALLRRMQTECIDKS